MPSTISLDICGMWLRMKSRLAPTRLAKFTFLSKMLQVVAFADEAFDDFDHRALAQIVRSRLETEAQNTDSLCVTLAVSHDQLQSPSDLHFVARQDRGQDRQFQIMHFGLVGQSPQILRQTRSAKGKTGQEVSRRDIELLVLAEDLHHFVCVDRKATCKDSRFRWQSRS